MRLFIDESLSPRLADALNATGDHDVSHPLLGGGRGSPITGYWPAVSSRIAFWSLRTHVISASWLVVSMYTRD